MAITDLVPIKEFESQTNPKEPIQIDGKHSYNCKEEDGKPCKAQPDVSDIVLTEHEPCSVKPCLSQHKSAEDEDLTTKNSLPEKITTNKIIKKTNIFENLRDQIKARERTENLNRKIAALERMRKIIAEFSTPCNSGTPKQKHTKRVSNQNHSDDESKLVSPRAPSGGYKCPNCCKKEMETSDNSEESSQEFEENECPDETFDDGNGVVYSGSEDEIEEYETNECEMDESSDEEVGSVCSDLEAEPEEYETDDGFKGRQKENEQNECLDKMFEDGSVFSDSEAEPEEYETDNYAESNFEENQDHRSEDFGEEYENISNGEDRSECSQEWREEDVSRECQNESSDEGYVAVYSEDEEELEECEADECQSCGFEDVPVDNDEAENSDEGIGSSNLDIQEGLEEYKTNECQNSDFVNEPDVSKKNDQKCSNDDIEMKNVLIGLVVNVTPLDANDASKNVTAESSDIPYQPFTTAKSCGTPIQSFSTPVKGLGEDKKSIDSSLYTNCFTDSSSSMGLVNEFHNKDMVGYSIPVKPSVQSNFPLTTKS